MNNKIKSALLATGLLLGGAAIGQAFRFASIEAITASPVGGLSTIAGTLMNDYQTGASSSKSAAQIQQVAAEASIRLQYIQIKQNAEIIRLLGQIAAKK